MQKIAFTICSNNYLAQARALGDSLIKHNPEYRFYIGLVDVLSDQINYPEEVGYPVIPMNTLDIDDFDGMVKRYNITELNTAVKPSVFKYFFDTTDANIILYFDPDILVYDKFKELDDAFINSNFILTPHFFTPIFDNFAIDEPHILNTGLYNLGFLGLRRSDETFAMLSWWARKLVDQCYIAFDQGLFADQIWMNFVPLYYKHVTLLRHLGYNAAYWNLHERSLSVKDANYSINDQYNLVFFHFSGFSFSNPTQISRYQDRYSFATRPDIVKIFDDYHTVILNNGYEKFNKISCIYVTQHNKLNHQNEFLRLFIKAKKYISKKVTQKLNSTKN